MSISVTRRREACLRLLRSDFDIDSTVEWVLKEYSDEPTLERAKNKYRLARNICTIGGSGDQQALNLVAFEQAITLFGEEKRRKAVSALEGEVKSLKDTIETERSRNDELARDYREKVGKVEELQAALSDAKMQTLQLTSQPTP